VVLYTISIKSR